MERRFLFRQGKFFGNEAESELEQEHNGEKALSRVLNDSRG